MRQPSDVNLAIKGMAKVFSHDIDGETIAFYAKVLLTKLSPDEACAAVARWCAHEARWPAPAQIINAVRPKPNERDEASALAMKLTALIGRRGYTWTSTYRYDGHVSFEAALAAEVGSEAAVELVRRSGGWERFCREFGGDVGNTAARAQLRDLCAAVQKTTLAEMQALPPRRETATIEAGEDDEVA